MCLRPHDFVCLIRKQRLQGILTQKLCCRSLRAVLVQLFRFDIVCAEFLADQLESLIEDPQVLALLQSSMSMWGPAILKDMEQK